MFLHISPFPRLRLRYMDLKITREVLENILLKRNCVIPEKCEREKRSIRKTRQLLC